MSYIIYIILYTHLSFILKLKNIYYYLFKEKIFILNYLQLSF